ncbi:hypothetical protein [Paenibacillus wynnii]|uniref:hypothetical protein n=1 Tax=Paenibacillus wynnii TaxID=268407 RepID=UPI00278F31B4|nr:hypothetical protein [Paenibacillus wynnii]MDQ0192674.1 hypothetical protein [Paenibacillus wynnii]
MSRFGKKLFVVGMWAGIGILIGMQFGSIGEETKVSQVPGWNVVADAAQNANTTPPSSSPTYVYVPVTIDPTTGAVTSLPQQEVKDYSTLTPGQILVPEEQKPKVDVLADKTAGLLQQASQKSIRWVVSLFDSSEN